MTPFQKHHFIQIFESLGTSPIDLKLRNYFSAHKSLGATDRRVIGETLFGMIRWKSLLDRFGSLEEKWIAFRDLEKWRSDKTLPQYARLGLSPFLYEKFVQAFGVQKTEELAAVLNTQAPTVIRANLLKISPAALMERLKLNLTPCKRAPAGLQLAKREPLFALPEFKEGLFEMQDEGSQLVSELLQVKPGDAVLDYCSGSGGKTLAFAPRMEGKGQIFLHDIRPSALLEAKKRLKRAGIQNAQFLPPSHPQLKKLKSRCDWVLIDVPCSGTGTLRRNPDQKWKIDEAMLQRLLEEQRAIASAAVAYVKPGGRLVYATCSILPAENEEQKNFILNHLGLECETSLSLFPEEGGPDGFYAAVFRKKQL